MKIFVFLLFALSFLVLTNAQGTPITKIVVTDIKALTIQSQSLYVLVDNLSIFNIFTDGRCVVPVLVLTDNIIPAILSLTETLTTTRTTFDDADGSIIVDVLETFVKVHKGLLDILIGRFGLLSSFGFDGPIRTALVSLEAAIDGLALEIIRLIPTPCKDAVTIQFRNLDDTCKNVIKRYTNKPWGCNCDPSPAYTEEHKTREYSIEAGIAINEYYRRIAEYYEKPEAKQQHIRGSAYYRELRA